jgi:hypothetical protein
VEFALLVPLPVVILFAIIAVGIALFRVVNYTSAACEERVTRPCTAARGRRVHRRI